MISRPSFFWTSFLTSLGVNAVFFVSGACWSYSQQRIYLPGNQQLLALSPIYLDDPRLANQIQDTTLGDPEGKGDAADASPGDEPMEARLSQQAQALMSRDPEGPGPLGGEPSMSQSIPGENGNGDDGTPSLFGATAAMREAQEQPAFAAKPVAIVAPPEPEKSELTEVVEAKPMPAPKNPELKDIIGDGPNLPAEKEKPADAPAETLTPKPIVVASIADPRDLPSPPTPPAPAQAASKSGGGKPGPAVRPADPGPQTDSESDPFSTKNSVKFKRGSTDVQFGRKHKLVRPQLGLGAQTDMLSLRQPVTIVLALTLDEKGNVISVVVLKSSGSKDIDQATKVAAYQWWLEPSKDKSGKAVKDVVPFTVGFS